VGKRDASQRTRVVDEVPRLEVVGPVDDEVVAVDERLDVLGGHADLVCLDVDIGVQFGHERRGAVDLLSTHVVVAVDDLALEVREFNHVVVGDPERADTRRGEILDDRRPEPPGAQDEDVGVQEVALTVRADVVHDDVPRIPVELCRVEIEI